MARHKYYATSAVAATSPLVTEITINLHRVHLYSKDCVHVCVCVRSFEQSLVEKRSRKSGQSGAKKEAGQSTSPVKKVSTFSLAFFLKLTDCNKDYTIT